MNKHGISRSWFTETDVKHFKSDAIPEAYTFYGKLKKKSYLGVVVHKYRAAF